MRATIIPEDRAIMIDNVSHRCETMPLLDPSIHAIQFYSETGHATIEKKSGDPERLEGQAAAALIKPFVAAHATEVKRAQATADAQATTKAAAERAESERVAAIKALHATEEQAAAYRAALQQARDAARTSTAVKLPIGNVPSNGTQEV